MKKLIWILICTLFLTACVKEKSVVEVDKNLERKIQAELSKTAPIKVKSPLEGKIIANFGDSIFGNTNNETSISSVLSSLSDTQVFNLAFGGTRASIHAENWDAFSFYSIADSLNTGDWNKQEVALSNENWKNKPGYFDNKFEKLKSTDITKVDIVTINYGTNDYRSGKEIENKQDKYDINTYAGAMRYSIEKLKNIAPRAKIVIISPTWRYWKKDDGSYDTDSDIEYFNKNQNTLKDFVKAAELIAQEYNLQFIDFYYVGINKENANEYFSENTNDAVHQNEKGRKLLAEILYENLLK